jgi:hypothetical protein
MATLAEATPLVTCDPAAFTLSSLSGRAIGQTGM